MYKNIKSANPKHENIVKNMKKISKTPKKLSNLVTKHGFRATIQLSLEKLDVNLDLQKVKPVYKH